MLLKWIKTRVGGLQLLHQIFFHLPKISPHVVKRKARWSCCGYKDTASRHPPGLKRRSRNKQNCRHIRQLESLVAYLLSPMLNSTLLDSQAKLNPSTLYLQLLGIARLLNIRGPEMGGMVIVGVFKAVISWKGLNSVSRSLSDPLFQSTLSGWAGGIIVPRGHAKQYCAKQGGSEIGVEALQG